MEVDTAPSCMTPLLDELGQTSMCEELTLSENRYVYSVAFSKPAFYNMPGRCYEG